MKKLLLLIVALSFAPAKLSAYEWVNVGADDRLGGRMISAGYLRGKVVLLDRRDYGQINEEYLDVIKKLKDVWGSYKSKSFILLGCNTGKSEKEEISKRITSLGISYPVYNGATIQKDGETVLLRASFYVIDSTCKKCLYSGNDYCRAIEVAAEAIMNAASPISVEQYKALLDYEIENLPGRAFLRLADFKKAFPMDAKEYDEAFKKLSSDKDVKKLAKLVEFAESAKNQDPSAKKGKRITPMAIKSMIGKNEDLKTNENQFIAQEAKNALADLKWASVVQVKKRK